MFPEELTPTSGLARISHRISSRERGECRGGGADGSNAGAAVSTYCNLAFGQSVPSQWCYPRSQQEFGEKCGLEPTDYASSPCHLPETSGPSGVPGEQLADGWRQCLGDRDEGVEL